MYDFTPIFIQLIYNVTRSARSKGSEHSFVSAFLKLKLYTSKVWSDPGSGMFIHTWSAGRGADQDVFEGAADAGQGSFAAG